MELIDRIFFKLLRAKTTYSQFGEDMILSHIFNMLKKRKISYVVIGANHLKIFNNTYLFYFNRGLGVCVQPNPTLFEKIREVIRINTIFYY